MWPLNGLFLIVLHFRRQRARERQQKLLAEFASRQKSFMETAMDVGKKRPVHLLLRSRNAAGHLFV